MTNKIQAAPLSLNYPQAINSKENPCGGELCWLTLATLASRRDGSRLASPEQMCLGLCVCVCVGVCACFQRCANGPWPDWESGLKIWKYVKRNLEIWSSVARNGRFLRYLFRSEILDPFSEPVNTQNTPQDLLTESATKI